MDDEQERRHRGGSLLLSAQTRIASIESVRYRIESERRALTCRSPARRCSVWTTRGSRIETERTVALRAIPQAAPGPRALLRGGVSPVGQSGEPRLSLFGSRRSFLVFAFGGE
jgi:hypothetical protein